MKKDNPNKNICLNRKAGFDYFLEEKIEAGISLVGSEVKSLRDGKMSIAEAYAVFKKNELFLIGAHIPTYLPSGQFNHTPTRDRKLLLKKKELFNLQRDLTRKGYTLIPVRCYFKNGKAKVEIALAKGKKKYDKREAIKKKSDRREMRRP
jgi:SsrA-binding protein